VSAIELVCLICKKKFWSSGFDHICYSCACGQETVVYEAKETKTKKNDAN